MIGYRFSVIQAYLLANMRGFCPFAFINASNVCLLRNAVLYVSINRVCESIPQISASPPTPSQRGFVPRGPTEDRRSVRCHHPEPFS